MYKVETSTGWAVQAWCKRCHGPADPNRQYVPKAGIDVDKLKVKTLKSVTRMEECGVCKRVALLELHHLAPTARFPETSHLWPTIRVCHACHADWHARMR